MKLVTVYRVFDEGEAEVVRLALEDAGIACVIDNEHQGGFTGVLQVRVQVAEEDADRARQLIQDHGHGTVEEPPDEPGGPHEPDESGE